MPKPRVWIAPAVFILAVISSVPVLAQVPPVGPTAYADRCLPTVRLGPSILCAPIRRVRMLNKLVGRKGDAHCISRSVRPRHASRPSGGAEEPCQNVPSLRCLSLKRELW
jgi:hypothetical protein